jgi:hypothetical protein
MRRKWIFIAPLAILGMLLVAFVGGEVVKLLWNWLMPSLFGWRQLTFWEAFGLLAPDPVRPPWVRPTVEPSHT